MENDANKKLSEMMEEDIICNATKNENKNYIEEVHIPVSYTHLTLPTNREV